MDDAVDGDPNGDCLGVRWGNLPSLGDTPSRIYVLTLCGIGEGGIFGLGIRGGNRASLFGDGESADSM